MLEHVVILIATTKFPDAPFTTRQILDFMPDVERSQCASVTNALRRAAMPHRGYLTTTKPRGRLVFELTERGRGRGRWCRSVAAGYDRDVQRIIPHLELGPDDGF